jgi:hypothetical protein
MIYGKEIWFACSEFMYSFYLFLDLPRFRRLFLN